MARTRNRPVFLPPDTHARAQAYCARVGLDMAEWLEAWIELAMSCPDAMEPPPPPPATTPAQVRHFRARRGAPVKAEAN